VGIHRDDRAVLAVERLFCSDLQIEIDREPQVFAGDGELLTKVAKLFAMAIDNDVAASIFTAEQRVVGLFDARPTYA
jgi:hypothetical protein